MRKKYILLSVFFAVFGAAFSQEFLWKAGMHGFFDNNEFGGSQLRSSQTMAGIHLAPEVGVGMGKHRIFVGADLMHEFGSDQLLDYSDLIAYYEYNPITYSYITFHSVGLEIPPPPRIKRAGWTRKNTGKPARKKTWKRRISRMKIPLKPLLEMGKKMPRKMTKPRQKK